MNPKELLTKKIGPLPVWGWGIGVAGIALVAAKLKGNAADTPPVDATAASGQSGAYYPRGGGGGATYQVNARNAFSCPPGMFRGLDGKCHKKCGKGSFRGLDGKCHKHCPPNTHRALNGRCVPNGPTKKPHHGPPHTRINRSQSPPIFDRRKMVRRHRAGQGPG